MKPFVLLLVVAVAVLVLVYLLWLFLSKAARHYKREQRKAQAALRAIWDKADEYSDVDSVLAAEVRRIIRSLNKETEEIY